MRILLIYGTHTTGTYEAACIIRDVLRAKRHTVSLRHARTARVAALPRYDALIFGSCTWEKFVQGKRIEGQLQKDFAHFAAAARKQKLPEKPIAVYALGDSNFTYFCTAAVYLEKLVKDLGAKKVGSTLRINRFHHTLDANRLRVRAWAIRLAAALQRL